MSRFPTELALEHFPLREVDGLSDRGHEALDRLAFKGLEVVVGLRLADVSDVLAIADTPGVREFCPRDKKRFSDAAKWNEKGRAAFPLRSPESDRSVGIGWSGLEDEPTPELPNHPVTTAFRSTIRGTGKDLVIATVEGTRALYEDPSEPLGIGLETWASNTVAIGTYLGTGAILKGSRSHEINPDTGEMDPIWRPTLVAHPDYPIHNGIHHRVDTRLYMALPTPEPPKPCLN